jgi:poly-gamma-glutamate synthesis protein (capsule biosynthesis protein)
VKKGYTIEQLFDETILSRMRAADLLVINYESVVSDGGKPLSGKAYTFRTSTKLAKELLNLGTDLVGLANNHVYDYGKEGFLDTLDTFAEMGLPTVGAGRNAEQAYTPYYYEQSGMKIAVIAASRAEKNYMTPVAEPDAPGIAGCYDSALVCEAVKLAKENADYVIVYAHFGYEYSTTIEAVQRKAAYDFIDAGADLIVGAHAHILQGVDIYKGKPIFYNLGNFLFNTKELDTALLEITFESADGMPSFRFVPCRQSGGRVVDESGTAEGERILKDLQKLSPNVTITAEGCVLFS